MTKAQHSLKNKGVFDENPGLVGPISVQPECVTLLICPCRSGSTAMLRVFGYSGFTAVFQPVKNALRWRHLGQERPWPLPAAQKLFVKETFGPYHAFEVGFDPVDILLCAGLEADRLRVVVLLRDPATVWASWQEIWPGRTLLTTLEEGFRACTRSVLAARSAGVPVRALDYEACVDDPAAEFGALFDWLGEDLSLSAVATWDRQPGFAEPGSGIEVPTEPSRYVVPAAHARTIESRAFGDTADPVLPGAADQAAVAATDIPQLYRRLSRLPRASTA